jgi:1-acyl-sn-glycerol-3-phosphate acyltransferase
MQVADPTVTGVAVSAPEAGTPLRRILRRAWRLPVIVVALVVMATGVTLAPTAPIRHRTVHVFCRFVLATLGLRLHVTGRPSGERRLVASNHVSWLDVCVLTTQERLGFVAKSEVRDWPLIGSLTARLDTAFIDRGNAFACYRTLPDLQRRLSTAGMVIFPEGTTTLGHDVRHYHGMLFETAVRERLPVQPVTVRYRGVDGTPSRSAAFIDDDSLLGSLLRITGEPRVEVHLEWHPPVRSGDRRILARRCRHHALTSIAASVSSSPPPDCAFTRPSRPGHRTVTPGAQAVTPCAARDGGPMQHGPFTLAPPDTVPRGSMPDPIASPAPHALVAAELESREGVRELVRCGRFAALRLCAGAAPVTLREIGRLREATFRAAGEGTGRARDLDGFDETYEQIVLLDLRRGRIAGGYRLGTAVAGCGSVPSTRTPAGLYSHTLFELSPDFCRSVAPGIELGRSFVTPEYQRQGTSLFALWKAIGARLLEGLDARWLFGPVSISADYGNASRALMAAWLHVHAGDGLRAPLVRARARLDEPLPDVRDLPTLAALDAAVRGLESGQRGVPVLLRHYLGLGGRVAATSIDANFSGVLDALMCIDLLALPEASARRYLGETGAARLKAAFSGPGPAPACDSTVAEPAVAEGV